jgi:hypothetical protein
MIRFRCGIFDTGDEIPQVVLNTSGGTFQKRRIFVLG